jgi:hypothetical protein
LTQWDVPVSSTNTGGGGYLCQHHENFGGPKFGVKPTSVKCHP